MSRIDDIRARLNGGKGRYAYIQWDSGNFAVQDATEDIRALLAVAEAAQAVYAEHKRTYSAGQLIEELEAEQHRYDVVFGQLEVALQALDKQLDRAGG